MEKKYKPILIKSELYSKIENLRIELGLRALTSTIEYLIDEYKKK